MVRVFWDNDHAVLLKGGASLISQNNTSSAILSPPSTLRTRIGVPPGRAAQLTGDILWGDELNLIIRMAAGN